MPAGSSAQLAGATGLPDGSPAAPERVDLTARGRRRGVAARAGSRDAASAEIVADLRQRFGPLPGGVWPESPHTAVVLPIARAGQDRLAGFLVAGISPRRPLDDAYRGFLEVAGHADARTAFANARAYEEERRRAEALAEIDRAKTAFFSNVSHEFRTPLTLMLGPLEDLLAGAHRSGCRRASASCSSPSTRNALRLLKLVNTLLDFSRIEAGRVAGALRADRPRGAHRASWPSTSASAIERAGLRSTVDCPPLAEPVFVDRDMWEKIVLNLLSNAFKFTFDGRDRGLARGPDGERSSSGCATPAPASRPASCRACSSASTASTARAAAPTRASGIGLALVHELVKLHGGSVAVESAVGAGSTFTVRIPTGHGPPADASGWRRRAALSLDGRRGERRSSRRRSAGCPMRAIRTMPGARGDRPRRRRHRHRRQAGRIRPGADDNADMRDYVRPAARPSGTTWRPRRTAPRRSRRPARGRPTWCSRT